MNNMFDVNVRWDQPGPVQFCYSLRSHAGNWQEGRADEFGWDIMNPLLATVVAGKCNGPIAVGRHSFVRIDNPNVACTTIKPAEANGAGFVLRFVETQGRETTANVSLAFLPPMTAATETNLVEDDRPQALSIGDRQHDSDSSAAVWGQHRSRDVRTSGTRRGRRARNGQVGHGSGARLVRRRGRRSKRQSLSRLSRHRAGFSADAAEPRPALDDCLMCRPAAIALRWLDQQSIGARHNVLLSRRGSRSLEQFWAAIATGRCHHVEGH